MNPTKVTNDPGKGRYEPEFEISEKHQKKITSTVLKLLTIAHTKHHHHQSGERLRCANHPESEPDSVMKSELVTSTKE
jgi:hypothetical protein